jgi:predicted O-methyltransferase YrrM
MKNEFSNLNPDLLAYVSGLTVKDSIVMKNLREKTSHLELANMQISPIQGQFISFLVSITEAKKCLELGTFTGYSALVIADSLPEDGRLITCDINTDWTEMALSAWQEANLSHKIHLELAPARDTLNNLEKTDSSSFDFIFIDADKTNYMHYYQSAIMLSRPGGLIVIDNIFWDGKVIDPTYAEDKQTSAIMDLNEYISNDTRVISSIVPIADGLCLVKVL